MNAFLTFLFIYFCLIFNNLQIKKNYTKKNQGEE